MEIWNPWHGCKKYSEGCENCYMYFLDKQRSGRKCLISGSNRRIFCSTEMFNKEMLCEFVLSIRDVGGGRV